MVIMNIKEEYEQFGVLMMIDCSRNDRHNDKHFNNDTDDNDSNDTRINHDSHCNV